MPVAVVPGRNRNADDAWRPVPPLLNPCAVRPHDPRAATRAAQAFRARSDVDERRSEALAAIATEIGRIVAPAGYLRTRWLWEKRSPRGTTSVSLKRSHNGDRADILLDARRCDGSHPPGPWRGADAIRLGLFYHPRERAVLPFDAIRYADVLDGGALCYPMRVLAERAVPWLENLHSGPGGLTQVEQFLPEL